MMSRVLYLAVAIIVALIGLALHVRNDTYVVVDYVLGTAELSVSGVIVAALVGGVLLGVLGMTFSVLRLRYANGRLARRNEQIEREIANLRALSLRDAD
jgi:uncharacterized membrane protein YciS (DUF1049 family)